MYDLPHPLKTQPKTHEDQDFLKNLYHSRRTDLQQIDMPKSILDQLISMQHMMQEKGYANDFPDAQYFIISSQSDQIGQMIIHQTEDHLRLVDIALLPSFQGKGIGKIVLLGLIQHASVLTYHVQLSVSKNNVGARKLYASLGFQTYAEDDVTENMQWHYQQ